MLSDLQRILHLGERKESVSLEADHQRGAAESENLISMIHILESNMQNSVKGSSTQPWVASPNAAPREER